MNLKCTTFIPSRKIYKKEMKKCIEILFCSFTIALLSCCGSGAKKEKASLPAKEIKIIPFEYHEVYPLSEHASESPTLTLDFSLSLIDVNDSVVNNNISQAIAYTLFESTSTSIETACNKFIAQRKKEYKELYSEFLNNNKEGIPTVWFYNYYNANSEIAKGYKGYINYIIMWEEFTGGVHPYSYYTVLNFNPETGEEVVLSDILKDGYDEPLTEILINNLARQQQVENIEGLREKGYFYSDNDMFISNNFILEEEKIIFIYNKYEIAPYAFGDIMINVTYEELKDLLK